MFLSLLWNRILLHWFHDGIINLKTASSFLIYWVMKLEVHNLTPKLPTLCRSLGNGSTAYQPLRIFTYWKGVIFLTQAFSSYQGKSLCNIVLKPDPLQICKKKLQISIYQWSQTTIAKECFLVRVFCLLPSLLRHSQFN